MNWGQGVVIIRSVSLPIGPFSFVDLLDRGESVQTGQDGAAVGR